MIGRKTNLCSLMEKKCDICIGCGRCSGVNSAIHILRGAKDDQEQKVLSLKNEQKERLVTVDVGTTTIAMQLYREDGTVEDYFACVNPQIRYGADVLSRITEAEDLTKAEHMRKLVYEVLEHGIIKFQKRLFKGESLRMVIAANTTMVYLLLGYDTKELGRAPFRASRLNSVEIEIAGVPTYIFQSISSFIGGDITAGIFSLAMLEQDKISLLIDLGTNGEIVLGNREKMLACSTAAGPAFEGGANRGIWGADMVSLIAKLRREHIVDETGLMEEHYFETGIRIGDVVITQKAIRCFQLAKAAIRAGIAVLLKEYGIEEKQVERVVLAGGFGYYLNVEDAVQIGLLPKQLGAKTSVGGNTALAGAFCMGSDLLMNNDSGKQLLELLNNSGTSRVMQVINLAQEEEFEKTYIESMEL